MTFQHISDLSVKTDFICFFFLFYLKVLMLSNPRCRFVSSIRAVPGSGSRVRESGVGLSRSSKRHVTERPTLFPMDKVGSCITRYRVLGIKRVVGKRYERGTRHYPRLSW